MGFTGRRRRSRRDRGLDRRPRPSCAQVFTGLVWHLRAAEAVVIFHLGMWVLCASWTIVSAAARIRYPQRASLCWCSGGPSCRQTRADRPTLCLTECRQASSILSQHVTEPLEHGQQPRAVTIEPSEAPNLCQKSVSAIGRVPVRATRTLRQCQARIAPAWQGGHTTSRTRR